MTVAFALNDSLPTPGRVDQRTAGPSVGALCRSRLCWKHAIARAT
jgi:hypothetical protein